MQIANIMRVLVVLALVAGGCAQERPAPTFTARTELVTVPVVVVQKGRFLGGLKSADFTVWEDGKAKPIAFFEEVQAEPTTKNLSLAEPGAYTNALVDPRAPVPITAIVLDSASYSEAYVFENARKEAIKFVERYMRRGELMMAAIIEPRGLRIVHDFTTSPAELGDALRGMPHRLVARPNVEQAVQPADQKTQGIEGASSGVQNDTDQTVGNRIDALTDVRAEKAEAGLPDTGPRGEAAMRAIVREVNSREGRKNVVATLQALEQIARTLSGLPGRKTVLWVSPGFVCPTSDWMKTYKGAHVSIPEQCEALWQLLSAGNISVYPVNPEQPVNPTFSSGQCQGPCGGRDRPVLKELILQSFAQYTGGTVCSYRNDLDTCFRRAAEDGYRYYMLGYYTDWTQKPTWRKLHIKVRAGRASVRSRSGFMTSGAPPAPEEERKAEIEAAIQSPLEYTSVPFTVRWKQSLEVGGKLRYTFEIHIAPGILTADETDGNHIRLELAAVALNHAGQITFTAGHDLESHISGKALKDFRKYGLTYENATEVPEGTNRVKFIVRDGPSGKIGTVTTPAPIVAAQR